MGNVVSAEEARRGEEREGVEGISKSAVLFASRRAQASLARGGEQSPARGISTSPPAELGPSVGLDRVDAQAIETLAMTVEER